MSENGYGFEYRDAAAQQTAVNVGAMMTKVFGWMTAALAITAVVAMYVAQDRALQEAVVGNRVVFIGLLLGELALVWAIGSAVGRTSAGVATVLFVIYAVANGLTLSVLFLVYQLGSLASTFFVTSATFGVMALYGYTTRRDLTSLGSMLFMLLIGLIIASIVNMFLASSMLYWIITYAGVAIFVGLTAYDAQKIKAMAQRVAPGTREGQAVAIYGALILYLDFINLFLLLLRLMGRRK